jgi:large subunit ribosomal protein L19
MAAKLFQKIADEQCKDIAFPSFKVGDSVKVYVRIKEGEKERIQLFAGNVIARDGHGHTETFTVRRVSYGEGVERMFPLTCRGIERIEVERSASVRRAKLYYLRKKGKQLKYIDERSAKRAARPVAAPVVAAPTVAGA